MAIKLAGIISFNPRSRMGSDVGHLNPKHLPIWFQSTLPHGERRVGSPAIKTLLGFNPRSRMGSDPDILRAVAILLVSIHAPAWGATLDILETFFADYLFQSTLPHGEILC